MSFDQPLTELRLERWNRPPDEHDLAMLSLCVGPTLDVGCGPGRLTAHLAELGHVTLGIDIAGEAVEQTRERGGSALRRNVFDAVPGEGRWETVLVADGNIGIGGDPVALLRRLRELVDPRGRIVVELAPPGTQQADDWATLRTSDGVEHTFRWSVVGVDHIEDLAARAGLTVGRCAAYDERWCAVLEETA
ncbi:MAG: methyltransferase domain-containing protein [Nocardioides sp.]